MISIFFSLILVAVTLLVYLIKIVKVNVESYRKKGFTIVNKSDYNPKGKHLALADHQITIHNHYKSQGLKHLITVEHNKIAYIPLDNDTIKHILIKDFDHFINRGMEINEKADPLSGHLFNINDDRWRNWRTKLTPTFTTGKMKMMFPMIIKCAEPLTDILTEQAKKNDGVDIREILACYTTDAIASCAFGLECNSLKNPNEEFRAYGREYMAEVGRLDRQFPFWVHFLPKNMRYLFHPRRQFMKKITRFFIDVIQRTIDYREKHNILRKDFVHMLIQIKNRGTVSDDDNSLGLEEDLMKPNNIHINHLAAQSFVFYVGGFETSSTLMTFACYELSTHQDIQEKLRENILETIERHGAITYEAVQDMEYLEQVINETLRMHPPLPLLMRQCNKDYKIPGTDLVIEKGTNIKIMASALQRDEDLYPNPNKYNPDNFSKEAIQGRPTAVFLPFGDGPRNCIGLRFGKIQAKIGLITLLKDFRISLHEKTEYPLKYHPYQFILHVNGGLYVNLEKIN